MAAEQRLAAIVPGDLGRALLQPHRRAEIDLQLDRWAAGFGKGLDRDDRAYPDIDAAEIGIVDRRRGVGIDHRSGSGLAGAGDATTKSRRVAPCWTARPSGRMKPMASGITCRRWPW